MLTIRLQRIGKKKSPSYRFVVSENTRDTQAKSLEILGTYNPVQTPKILDIKKERVLHWVSLGVQLSNTVNNILVGAGIIEGKKEKSVAISNKRHARLSKKKNEHAEKVKKSEEAKVVADAVAVLAREQEVAQKIADAEAQSAPSQPAEETPDVVAETPTSQETPIETPSAKEQTDGEVSV